MKLKKVHDQVIVITGASSGIGLTTARMAAKRGSRVVLAARSRDALRQLTDEISSEGGLAVYVVADVSRQEDVRRIAQTAHEKFGGFDTWVNNAATGLYGRIEDIAIDDMRRLFETNLWGLIYGSLEAVKHLRTRGGALINVGSVVSGRALPLQSVYASSKQAVQGFTDALRSELEGDGAPISVTLVKPSAIDTPFRRNARNYLETDPGQVPPVCAPDAVARAILHCAQTPVREVFAGGAGTPLTGFGERAPRLAGRFMRDRIMPPGARDPSPRERGQSGLDQPSERLEERGGYAGRVAKTGFHTEASVRPVITGAVVAGAGLAIASLWHAISKGNRGRDE